MGLGKTTNFFMSQTFGNHWTVNIKSTNIKPYYISIIVLMSLNTNCSDENMNFLRTDPLLSFFYIKVDLKQMNHSKKIVELPPNCSFSSPFSSKKSCQFFFFLQKYNSDNVIFIVPKPLMSVHNLLYGIMSTYPVRAHSALPQPVFPVSLPASPLHTPSAEAILTVPWTLSDFHYSMPLQIVFHLFETSFLSHLPGQLLCIIKLTLNITTL